MVSAVLREDDRGLAIGIGTGCVGLRDCRIGGTYVGALRDLRALDDVPQHVDGGVGLDGDTGLHALLVDIADQLAGAGAVGGCLVGGIGRGDGGDGCFVVEAVQVAAGLAELADPFVRLRQKKNMSAR